MQLYFCYTDCSTDNMVRLRIVNDDNSEEYFDLPGGTIEDLRNLAQRHEDRAIRAARKVALLRQALDLLDSHPAANMQEPTRQTPPV